jgi:hypothetical protein
VSPVILPDIVTVFTNLNTIEEYTSLGDAAAAFFCDELSEKYTSLVDIVLYTVLTLSSL